MNFSFSLSIHPLVQAFDFFNPTSCCVRLSLCTALCLFHPKRWKDLVPFFFFASVTAALSNFLLPSTALLRSQKGHREREARRERTCACVYIFVRARVKEGGVKRSNSHLVSHSMAAALPSPCVVLSVCSEATGEPGKMTMRCLCPTAPDIR